MKGQARRNFIIIGLSLILSMMLSIFPWPELINGLQPDWVALVVIYWSLVLPHRFSVGLAWLTGLLLDVLQGTLLGEHGLGLVVISFIVVKYHMQLRLYPPLQQAFAVLILLYIYKFLVYWPQGLLHHSPVTNWYWIAPWLGMLLWPWLFQALRATHQYFNLN